MCFPVIDPGPSPHRQGLACLSGILRLTLPLLLACEPGWSGCRPGDPAGTFAGTALSQQAGKLDVSLKLRCSNGQYEGELTTPVGNFTVTAATAGDGGLHLELTPVAAGGDAVTIASQVEGDRLQGSFVSGDDKGMIDLKRVADSTVTARPEPNSNLTKEQWRQDLAFFAAEIPKRHANAFHSTPRPQFEAAIASLEAKIDHLNPDEIYAGMDQIANAIGDAHTYIEFPADEANLPIDIRQFGDDYRVIAVEPGNEKSLGARVAAIDKMPIARARELAGSLTPVAETPELARSRIAGFLTTGMALHGLGITADRNVAHFTLEGDSGQEFTVEIHALAPGSHVQWVSAAIKTPLYRQDPNQKNWCKYLSESRTLYCRLRQIRNLRAPGKEMRDLVDREKPEKLVIDLRQNGGGDFNEGLRNFIHPIRGLESLNRMGHLFVLIGPDTFSAAMSNAAQFREQTAAMLVGETIGERPNSYQESRHVALPKSRWEVHYSVRFYKFIENGENIIRPDKEIIPTWEDFKSGRDPVLEWVLKYEPE